MPWFRAFGICSLFSQEHSSLVYPCGFHLLLLAVCQEAFQLPTMCMLYKQLRAPVLILNSSFPPPPQFFFFTSTFVNYIALKLLTVVRNLTSHICYFFSPYISKQALSPVSSFLTSCLFVPFFVASAINKTIIFQWHLIH